VGERIAALSGSGKSLCPVQSIAVSDTFVPQGSRMRQWEYCGLTAESVVNLYRAAKAGAP